MITTEISPFLLLSQVSLFSSSAFFLIFFKFYFYFYSRYLDEKSARKRKIDLVAVISGGAEVTRGLHRNITLNASLSYDPEVAHANQPRMKFTWHYGKVPGIPFSKQAEAKADKDFITAVHESAIHYYGKASGEQISLNTKAMSVNQTLITPPSGISLKTDFRLSCSHWKSENNPLSYQFQYRLKNDLYNVLYRGVNNNINTSWIPPGNNAFNFVVKVIATVTDNFGVSASPVSSTVQVSR